MEWKKIEESWDVFKNRAQLKWRRLTDEDLQIIAGRRDHLGRKLQERYGFTEEHIQKELDDWSRWQTAAVGPQHTPLVLSRRASK
jgi:uncharacterized protein YjbJ (UPF0337 family)